MSAAEIIYDAVIVGSGFGGSVTAARLAEAGWKVLVLERGRRWKPEEMPRGPGDAWLYDVDEPEKQNGWLDFRWFGDMSVAMGAGVGGGSLIYGNVSIIPPRETFNRHWPSAINYEALLPYYNTVGEVLNIQDIPDGQEPFRFHAMKKGAEAIGAGDKFKKVPLAVTFDPEWRRTDDESCYEDSASKKFTNPYGRQQGTCNHCGFCCSGCHLGAKNTLDFNYLAIAEDNGANILPLHIVESVQPIAEGYAVHTDCLENETRTRVMFKARRVVLSAGSLGSTEILLRSRDELAYLPNISKALGQGWSSNGDFVTFSTQHEETGLTRSPTISCAVDYLEKDGYHGAKIFVEDGALGDVPTEFVRQAFLRAGKRLKSHWLKRVFSVLAQWVGKHHSAKNTIAWFAQSVDASDGQLVLRRNFWMPWKKHLHLRWDIRASQVSFEKVNALHKALATANKPKRIITMFTWKWFKDITTPHPLGGCRMADSPEQGVVSDKGEVFSYPGLYVADGAIIPFALGINPSRTIAALAERNVALMLKDAAKDS